MKCWRAAARAGTGASGAPERQRHGVWLLAAGAVLLVTAGPLRGAASALWHPIGALETAVA
jgi:hypothetical protein